MDNKVGDIELSQIEYCYIAEDQSIDNDNFKIVIPKLMSSLLNTLDTSYSLSIFSNDDTCRPTPNKINLQSYISVQKSNQCVFDDIVENGIITKDTRVICTCMNSNIKDITITDYDYNTNSPKSIILYNNTTGLNSNSTINFDDVKLNDNIIISVYDDEYYINTVIPSIILKTNNSFKSSIYLPDSERIIYFELAYESKKLIITCKSSDNQPIKFIITCN